MAIQEVAISIFGSAGGVAKALLSLLNKSILDPNDPLHSLINNSKLHFIDYNQRDINYYNQICPDLLEQMVLYEFNLEDLTKVREHVFETKTTLIIDLSWANTIDILDICNDFGISYVNTE